MIENVTVIIRTVGERTTAACRALIAHTVPDEHIITISERPFSKAVRRGFELGVERGLTWTYCLDADVLLRRDGLTDLMREAERQPDSLFYAEGRIADKLLGHVRFAGNHLYRTSLLPHALQNTEITDQVIRPEKHVKRQMVAQGFTFLISETIVGTHDFEQFYVDIFRKALVHCNKFALDLEQYAVRYWQTEAAHDPDLRVASWAVKTHDIFAQQMKIDRDLFPDSLETLLTMAGMVEREPLSADAISPDDVSKILADFENSKGYQAWERFMQVDRERGRLLAVVDRYGLTGAPMHVAARGLLRIGRSLKRRSDALGDG